MTDSPGNAEAATDGRCAAQMLGKIERFDYIHGASASYRGGIASVAAAGCRTSAFNMR
jgi:hypothetical protein